MSSEKEQPLDLTEITTTFGEAYFVVKDTDAIKKSFQQKFFEAATKALKSRPLPQKIVAVPQGTKNTVEWAARFHPGWTVITQDPQADQIMLQQDPSLMKFTFINPIDRRVYGRTTVDGGQYLDDERLHEQDPDLWSSITRWDVPDWLPDLLYENGVDSDDVDDVIEKLCEQQGISRVLVPTDQLTSEQLEALQPYMVPGPVSVKLVPPRPAKEEELES